MLTPSCVRSGLLLLLAAWATAAPGIIEIVEEQRCHDHVFRLTCRDLDTHIAVLEAWYTATRDLFNLTDFMQSSPPTISRRDAELDQVFVYSSPRHDGFYETTNRSLENATRWDVDANETINDVRSVSVNTSASESYRTVSRAFASETLNISCGVQPYVKSYASWKHKGKILQMPRDSSINLRAPVSYRCTGINHCSFLLAEDYPPALTWSPGVVFIKYACFDDLVSVHYCNREVHVSESGVASEGYVRTPGYPHFYAGGTCRWRITANPEQRLRITLLDVSLRSIGPFESECTDYVEILEANGARVLSTCDQPELPLQLTSASSQLDVLVVARSLGAFPKRGVLLHYKSVGCVTLSPPSDGYRVYRDGELAHYMCNINYVFADSQQRARLLKCYDDNIWNDTLSPCIKESPGAAPVNDSVPDSTSTDRKMANENNMIVDIVIPSLLIAVLFIGNAFIVLIIYKYRKRKTDETEDEFNTIPLSVNGNVHSAGNAV